MELQNRRQKAGTWIFAPNGQFLFRCMARIYGLVDACYCAHHALKIDGEKSQQVRHTCPLQCGTVQHA